MGFMKNFGFQKDGVGFFLKTSLTFYLPPLLLISPGNSNSEISSLITTSQCQWPSAFVPVNHIYVPPALHPKSCSRVEVKAYARICMSVCLGTSRVPTDSDNDSKTYVS